MLDDGCCCCVVVVAAGVGGIGLAGIVLMSDVLVTRPAKVSISRNKNGLYAKQCPY